MSSDHDSYVRDLNQIRAGQESLLEKIEFIKGLHPDKYQDDLEAIRAANEQIISEIDEIRRRRDTSVKP